MYNLYKAIHHRMQKFLTAETTLTSDASAGSSTLNVTDATLFDYEGLNDNVPTIMLMDNDTSGKKSGSGFQGAELIDVDSVDTDTNTITTQTNLSSSWLASNGALIRRAPGSQVVKEVIIGDLAVVKKFPTVCVVPTNETIDWFTMPGGTIENITIDFMIYTAGGDTETATEEMLKLTKVVKWILMSNLHIQVSGTDSVYSVTSKAIVSNIDYGYIQKGSELLKSSKLTWNGDLYVLREYLGTKVSTPALYTGD